MLIEIELHEKIERDEKIYNIMKVFGELELVETLSIDKMSFNDFTDEYENYQEYIYTYNYKIKQGFEQVAKDFVETMYNHDIFN